MCSSDPNWRAVKHLDAWLKARNIIGLSGLDTRALTALIREHGMPNAVIAHNPKGQFDIAALTAKAKAMPSMDGLPLNSHSASIHESAAAAVATNVEFLGACASNSSTMRKYSGRSSFSISPSQTTRRLASRFEEFRSVADPFKAFFTNGRIREMQAMLERVKAEEQQHFEKTGSRKMERSLSEIKTIRTA